MNNEQTETVQISLPRLEGSKGLQALRDVVLAYQRNFRLGLASTKSRGAVSGSGKKPYRQKGTGMARHGEKRSPIWRGGGVVFGPHPRNFYGKIDKKLRRLALLRSLSDCMGENRLVIVGKLELPEPRTKLMVEFLKNLSLGDGKILFSDVGFEDNFALALHNLPRVFAVEANSLNALDVVLCDRIVFSVEGLSALENRLLGQE